MLEVKEIKCKNCGNPLNVNNAVDGVLECEYCHSFITLPKQETSPEALEYIRIGQHELDSSKFDEAYIAFEKASQCDNQEPEAFWGMAISKAKVQYLKDIVNNRLQPICHEISNKKIVEDKNYLKALELATIEQKEKYIQRGQEIDYIRAEFNSLRNKGLDYDCFICVKVSDGKGNTTPDCNDANDLYFHLKDKGYSPFFSEREVKNRKGADYEALILYALYTSECMLIVCNNEEYLETPWVKNEYTRFNNLVNDEEKERNSITFVFRNNPIEKLPGKKGKIEGIDLSKPDAYGRIEEYISSFNKISITSNLTIERKNYDSIKIKKQVSVREGVKKRTLSMQQGGTLSVSDNAKLKVAKEFIEQNNFDVAINYIDALLQENKLNGEAYLLRFLAELQFCNKNEIVNNSKFVKNYDCFEKAISLMDESNRKELYDLLYKRVLNFKYLNDYDEYVTLPESEDSKIVELTDVMFKEIINVPENEDSNVLYEYTSDMKLVSTSNSSSNNDVDEEAFEHIIKTVTDTKKYINMNLQFAKKISQNEALVYYQNVLSVDEGNHEALLHKFIIENGIKKDSIFNSCLQKETNELEESLFAYGYNGEACDYLFSLCTEYVDKNAEGSCKLFDFILTMIPEKLNNKFIKMINTFIETLFKSRKLKYAIKYNDILISLDKYDYWAYFNKTLLKYNYFNPLQLMQLGLNLMKDADYISAINSYSEKNPDKKNLFMKIYNNFQVLSKFISDNRIMKYVFENCYILKDDLINCIDIVKSTIKTATDFYLKNFLSKYHCKQIHEVYKLREVVVDDENLQLALACATMSNNSELANKLKDVYILQRGRCEQNIKKHNQMLLNEKRYKNAKLLPHLYVFIFLAIITLNLLPLIIPKYIPLAINTIAILFYFIVFRKSYYLQRCKVRVFSIILSIIIAILGITFINIIMPGEEIVIQNTYTIRFIFSVVFLILILVLNIRILPKSSLDGIEYAVQPLVISGSLLASTIVFTYLRKAFGNDSTTYVITIGEVVPGIVIFGIPVLIYVAIFYSPFIKHWKKKRDRRSNR